MYNKNTKIHNFLRKYILDSLVCKETVSCAKEEVSCQIILSQKKSQEKMHKKLKIQFLTHKK